MGRRKSPSEAVRPDLGEITDREKHISWGTCLAQSVKPPTSAQAVISRFVSSSPAAGSVLSAQGLEPASDSVSPSLSVPPPLTLCLSFSVSLSLSKINIKNFLIKKIMS